MNTKDLIEEALSLPIEKRVMVVETILKSMNPPEEAIDKQWAEVARKRLLDLRSGKAESIPGEEVFKNIRSSIR